MNNEGFLPLGTVVLLNGAERDFIIIGYKVNSNNTLYDYVGCVLPYGVKNKYSYYYFNKDQINKVIYPGYEDEKWSKLKIELDK